MTPLYTRYSKCTQNVFSDIEVELLKANRLLISWGSCTLQGNYPQSLVKVANFLFGKNTQSCARDKNAFLIDHNLKNESQQSFTFTLRKSRAQWRNASSGASYIMSGASDTRKAVRKGLLMVFKMTCFARVVSNVSA